MKRLAILRHAESSAAEGGMADFARPLNDRGRLDARAVGRELAEREVTFDRVIASPAARVRETLRELARGYGQALDAELEPELYGATSLFWLEAVRQLPEAANAALVVGHNPAFHSLVLDLTQDSTGLRDKIRGDYPSGALAIIAFDVSEWPGVEPARGRLVELILPRDLC